MGEDLLVALLLALLLPPKLVSVGALVRGGPLSERQAINRQNSALATHYQMSIPC